MAIAAALAIELGAGQIGQYSFNPPFLFLALNLIILGGVSFIIAYLSAKGYLLTGSLTLLLITISFIFTGIMAIINGLFANFSSNWAITEAAIGLLFFSVLQIFAAFQASFRSVPIGSEHRKTRLTLACLTAVSLSALLSLLIWLNVFPPFFINGIGTTLIDQIAYTIIILLFSLSCLLFLRLYLKSKSNVLYWYSLALSLYAIGSFGITLQVQFGDVIAWTGRFSVYIGTIYFLIAMFSSRKSGAV